MLESNYSSLVLYIIFRSRSVSNVPRYTVRSADSVPAHLQIISCSLATAACIARSDLHDSAMHTHGFGALSADLPAKGGADRLIGQTASGSTFPIA
jgi:hypothetical protein